MNDNIIGLVNNSIGEEREETSQSIKNDNKRQKFRHRKDTENSDSNSSASTVTTNTLNINSGAPNVWSGLLAEANHRMDVSNENIKTEEIEINDQLSIKIENCFQTDENLGFNIKKESLHTVCNMHDFKKEVDGELLLKGAALNCGAKTNNRMDVYKETIKSEKIEIDDQRLIKIENCYQTDENFGFDMKKQVVCNLPDFKREDDGELLLEGTAFNCAGFISTPKESKYHPGKYSRTCNFCGKFFIHKLLLVHHFLVYHFLHHPRKAVEVRKNIVSKKCNKNFLNRKYIQYEIWLKMFQQNRYLKRNVKNRKAAFLAYKKVSKNFKYKNVLNYHMFYNSEKPGKSLNSCSKLLTRKFSLNRYVKIHTGKKPFKCNICSKFFKAKDSLKNHLKIHTCEKPFKCNICLKFFTQKWYLKTHLNIHNGEKPFKCNICSKLFTHQSIFKQHLRIHSGEKPFKCEICSKFFTDRSNLNTHHRIHTDEKPFKCNICSKLFKIKCNLQSHIRSHYGEKPFKCEVCSNLFTEKSSLTKHLKIHTGEKPYQCNICSKFFRRNYRLKEHLRVHTGEKPFKCDVCLKFFSDKSSLRKHLKIHSGEKLF